MEFDFREMPETDRYRLLCSFVTPRPIALVTTLSVDGCSNAAPMSFFNVFSEEPPILILGVQHRAEGGLKDTAINIRDTGEFVVNMVDMAIAEQMATCSLNFPSDVDEVEKSGLSLVSSVQVRPGRLRESPCSMECRLFQTIDLPGRSIVLGEVVQMTVRDNCLDDDGHYVLPEKYQPIGRLHANKYIVTDHQFTLNPTADAKDLR